MRMSALRWLDPRFSCCSAAETPIGRAPIGKCLRACRINRLCVALATVLPLPRLLCFVRFGTTGAAVSRLDAPLSLPLLLWPRRVPTRGFVATGTGCATAFATSLASGLFLIAASSAATTRVAISQATDGVAANCGSKIHGEKPPTGAA